MLKFIIVIAYMVVSKLKALKIPSERGYSYTNAAAALVQKVFLEVDKNLFLGTAVISVSSFRG